MSRSVVHESAAWLVKQLTTSRVFDPAQIAPYLAEFKSQSRNGDARALADFFIANHLLTTYQADRVLAHEASKLVLGPYLLAKPLGSGSLGNVFQAIGRSDRKLYAVKVLPLRSLWNVKLAKAQVQTCSKLLDHPSIVPFVDVDSAGGFHYLVWPYVEGATLTSRVESRGYATISTALTVMSQVAEGLSICHNGGIAHGLVNPSNILIGVDSQARILDLGVGAILSENIADDESMLDTMSAANATMGMLDCCAPETLNSPTLRDPTSDQYSFGCVFYFLLTGRLPFADGNVVDRVLAHQVTPPPSVRELNPEVPSWVDDLIQRTMSKTPSRRFASMQEVLGRLLSGAQEERRHASEPRLDTTLIGAAAVLPNRVEANAAPIDLMPANTEVKQSRLRMTNPATATPSITQKTPTPNLIAEQATQAQATSSAMGSIDFGHYPDADQGNLSEWSGPGGGAIPTRVDEPRIINDILPSPAMQIFLESPRTSTVEKPTVKPARPKRVPANLQAPVIYTDSGKLAEPAPNAGNLQLPTSLPSFTRSWWYRLKSWLQIITPVVTDVVQVSIYGPARVAPGESIKLQVYAHLPSSFESVSTLTRAFSHDAALLGTVYLERPVTRGQELSYHLKIANAGVAQSLLTHFWVGQPQPKTFQVHVPWEAYAGPNPVVLSVGIDGMVVGQAPVTLEILPRKV